jgi:hypothetical protein
MVVSGKCGFTLPAPAMRRNCPYVYRPIRLDVCAATMMPVHFSRRFGRAVLARLVSLQHQREASRLVLEFIGAPNRPDQEVDMNSRVAAFRSMLVAMSIACGSSAGQAADINGIWVLDTSACSKAFEKSGGRVSFSKDAGLYVTGFIIDGNQIRGKIANCAIKLRKDQGEIVNLIAVCSTDIAIDTMQFRLRMDGPDKLVREFPGIPELKMPYQRCSL